MYLGFYGLEKEPFNITPDPEFLYFSPAHKEAFAAVTYGVTNRKGFIVMTGEVGTGKTTVLRAYLSRVNKEETDCIYIFTPNLSFPDLLKLLLHEMGHDVTQRETTWMLQWLHWSLIRRYRAGRNVAVIIDEAQNMPVETLEQLRVLSNLETTKEKLLQVVLVGQPELDAKLDLHNLRQLKQRITVRSALKPLTRAESEEYIRHRIEQAGGRLCDIFAPAAVSAMVRYGKGIPRRLNVVAANSLLSGFGSQRRPVTARIVREIAAELEGSRIKPWMKWAAGTISGLAIMVAVALSFSNANTQETIQTPKPAIERQAQRSQSIPPGGDHASVALDMMSKGLTDSGSSTQAQQPSPQQAPQSVQITQQNPQPSQPNSQQTEAPQQQSTQSATSTPQPSQPSPAPTSPVQQPTTEQPVQSSQAVPTPPPPQTTPSDAQLPTSAQPSTTETTSPPVQATPQPAAQPVPQNSEPKAPTSDEKADKKTEEPKPPIQKAPQPSAIDAQEAEAIASAPVLATRVAKPGEYLSRMIAEVYGASSDKLIRIVRLRNPKIGDPDLIIVGQTIVFPEIAPSEQQRQ